MGLRTASVRHPHAEVMAPALTETNPTPTFKLPLDEQSASPVNHAAAKQQQPAAAVYIARAAAAAATTCKLLPLANGIPPPPPSDAAHVAGEPSLNGDAPTATQHPPHVADSPLPPPPLPPPAQAPQPQPHAALSMADRDTAMGLRRSHPHDGDDVADLLLLKTTADVDDQLFDASAADDIMQVFKAIGGEDGDLTALGDDDADDLFGGVDVLNMSLDEEQRECARAAQIRAHLEEVRVRHAKLERKFDFLLRRIRKHQMRSMGQHAAAEVAGVFENVARSLKRYAADAVEAAAAAVSAEAPPADAHADLKPMAASATKNLIKKLELNNAMQANAAFRVRMRKLSLAGGVVPPDPFRQPPGGQALPLPKWPLREKKELANVAGYLESEVRFVQEEVDSEATASSSGAESCDDTETYNNPHQQHLSINKRAAWKYATERAAIGSKWTWLQSQIADLEYKIRQYSELYRKLRASKEPVKLGGVSPPPMAAPSCLNGYRGQLPGATVRNGESSSTTTTAAVDEAFGDKSPAPPPAGDYQCARTRPLLNFRKRKLMQVTGLHAVSKKAERPATMRCGCTPPAITCALCTGRVDPTYPRDHAEYLSRNESLGLLDPSYHPVFSLNDAASASLQVEGIIRTHDWKQWSVRSSLKAMPKVKSDRAENASASAKELSGPGRPRKSIEHRKKNNRLIKPSTANALSAKIKNRARGKKPNRSGSLSSKRSRKRSRNTSAQSLGSDGNDEEMEVLGMNAGGKFDSPNESPLLQHTISNFNKRNRADSYDIDNIIIPFSVATTVRVEKLPYKEILTPKWRRIADDDSANANTAKHNEVKNNGIVKTSQDGDNLKEVPEDLSDMAVLIRHEKSEQDERKKFLSYLKMPIGYGRSRANRRTDSLAESSGANTPDPMSPASVANFDAHLTDKETSRPPTPKPDEHLITAARRRTISHTRGGGGSSGADSLAQAHDAPLVPPYEKRVFPLMDETYQRMLRRMQLQSVPHALRKDDLPESQPPSPFPRSMGGGGDSNEAESAANASTSLATPLGVAPKEHDSESTESAFGDDDPDPTDPEWEAERAAIPFNR